MKIKEITLRGYKRFVNPQTFKFCDEDGMPYDMILIVGNNGSGKTSILQAIAAVVGSAIKPHFSPVDLDWLGFKYDHIQTGRLPIDIKAKIIFDSQEIKATQEYAKKLADKYPDRDYDLPSSEREITLKLDYANGRVLSGTSRQLYQIKGYQYALQLSKFEVGFSKLFERVGSIYWYTEQRTSTSVTVGTNGEETDAKSIIDESKLREFLVKWYRFHDNLKEKKFQLREGQRDIYDVLEKNYRQIFQSRKFIGPAPKMGVDQLFETEDFWFSDERNQYELSGMSGGERSIFPLLVDFANWNINNSIIIIDEVELHLHPPLQQSLIRALPKLGKNNQFIITSHSDEVATMFPEEQIIRLPNE